jgi:hypothetical protein
MDPSCRCYAVLLLRMLHQCEGSRQCAVLFRYQLEVLLEGRLVTILVSFPVMTKAGCLGIKETEVSSTGKG